jgi:hypothetical protein
MVTDFSPAKANDPAPNQVGVRYVPLLNVAICNTIVKEVHDKSALPMIRFHTIDLEAKLTLLVPPISPEVGGLLW